MAMNNNTAGSSASAAGGPAASAGTPRRRAVRVLTLPVLPLRGLTVFPHMELHFDIGRDVSVRALEIAMERDQRAFLVTQLDAREDSPGVDDLYKFGTIAKVRQHVRIAADTLRVRVEGLSRGEALRYMVYDAGGDAGGDADDADDADDGDDREGGEDGDDCDDECLMAEVIDHGHRPAIAYMDSVQGIVGKQAGRKVAGQADAAAPAVQAANQADKQAAGQAAGQADAAAPAKQPDAAAPAKQPDAAAPPQPDGAPAPAMRPVSAEVYLEALHRQACQAFEDYMKLSGKFAPDMPPQLLAIKDIGELSDVISANTMLKTEHKQALLEATNPILRVEALLGMLAREIEVLSIERDIHGKVRRQIDKSQREYYLREQAKVIQGELGEPDTAAAEAQEYREKIAKKKLPKEAEEKALKEADRLSKMHLSFPDSSVVRSYLDWILDLPWTDWTEENDDLAFAERVLAEDHYGLEKVKERIVEYLAVRMQKKRKSDLKGPILCLIGPPGVGKTSVAKSVARALNRKYVRMSLGGVRDEAEIRGHRRTYIGAIPGRIISAMKQAGSCNPLILLDEIDKLGNDYRGDPASALLEALDGEQNFAFRDHYIELPYDLSQTLFITTANSADTIPRPLLDRMEQIHISGYTEEEKVRIALDFLVPKQLEAHGAGKGEVRFGERAVRTLVNSYTRESGVRTLEREIAAICRKSVRMLVSGEKKAVTATPALIKKMLGAPKYRVDKAASADEIGVARGLAWTPVGGDTLNVEVNVMDGKGKLELTGQLGGVMRESAKAAVSFVRSRAGALGIEEDFYGKRDIHVHVPEGATPKDGPSAGITIATAMVSALSHRPVRRNVAMTGEITLRGRVLPIGGLKEKALAARRAGIDTVVIPKDNQKDLETIPDNVKEHIRFVPVSSMDEALRVALARCKEI